MAGIHLLEMLGDLIRWSLFGFKKSYQLFLKDEKNEGVIPRNFFVGAVTFLTILLILLVNSVLKNKVQLSNYI